MQDGIDKLTGLAGRVGDVGVSNPDLSWNMELMTALEVQNLYAQADVVAHSALSRTESRGAHIRDDHEQRDDDNWLKHTVAWRRGEGDIEIGDRPVRLDTLRDDAETFPPTERKS